ncbi:2-dehydropantoate 2-reductase (Ketopantoate reductase) (KPA reductase) (KPR) [Exophiala xenobiotica]|nr:2-dehydropantoate 2-reductase (Ketopantoate reductase) (KPA reductase) (KPR) [Exophiala xenobiotica]
MAQSQRWWSPSPSDEDDSASEPASFESKPLEDATLTEPEKEKLLTRRVHLLGLGSIGTLIAHSLRCLPNPPPITLMMHKQEQYEAFKRGGRSISLIDKKNDINDEQTGYDVDIYEGEDPTSGPIWRSAPDLEGKPGTGTRPRTNPIEADEILPNGQVYIYSLIVAVKGGATVSALRSVKHRVDARTTICFMQNGLGQIEELNRRVFTDPETRPTYMLGIVSHGSYMADPCAVVHAGYGTIALGICRDKDRHPLPPKTPTRNISELAEDERKRFYPSDKDLFANLSSRYLLRTLTRSTVLACAAFPYLDLLQLQLEKLAANAVLNPLTALLDVPNGALLLSDELSPVQRLLLAEVSLVIRGLPELEGIPNVRMRFSAKRLEQLAIAVIRRTAQNSSSMREDIRHGKKPEIDYINGYIVKRGEEQGIKCVLNFMLMQLIKGKDALRGRDYSLPYGTRQIETHPILHQQQESLADDDDDDDDVDDGVIYYTYNNLSD